MGVEYKLGDYVVCDDRYIGILKTKEVEVGNIIFLYDLIESKFVENKNLYSIRHATESEIVRYMLEGMSQIQKFQTFSFTEDINDEQFNI